MLEEYQPIAPYNEQACVVFKFNVKNFAPSYVDFNLFDQIFYRGSGDTVMYRPSRDVLEHFGALNADPLSLTRYAPNEEKTIYVPLCHSPTMAGEKKLGIIIVPYDSHAGSASVSAGGGGDFSFGADAVIYVDFSNLAPWPCSRPPEQGYYPEVMDPPGYPKNFPFLTLPMGARAPGAPVSFPPCTHITRGFGCSRFWTGVYGAGVCPADTPWWHTGIDFACPEGSPVASPLGGTIYHRGCDGSGYGCWAGVESDAGAFRSLYAHLAGFGNDPLCRQLGQPCEAGRIIGYSGNTGASSGPHLHWEWRVYNTPVDPQLYASESRLRNSPDHLLASAKLLSVKSEPTPTPGPGGSLSPHTYPLSIVLRGEDGMLLSGPTIAIMDIDSKTVGDCRFLDGRCDFSLPSGVYSLRLEGYLADGTPVDAYGRAAEATQSRRAEVYYGPLAIWHAGPQTTVGLVLLTSSGLAQPFFDANPTGTPAPVDPMLYLETVATSTSPQPVQLTTGGEREGTLPLSPPATVTPVPTLSQATQRPGIVSVVVLFMCIGAVVFAGSGIVIGQCLRRAIRRRT